MFYEVNNWKPDFYRIGNRYENDWTDLIVGEHHAVVFDLGYGYDDLKAVVRSITDLPLIVIDSHGHLDHACGNFRFDEPIFIGEEDMELCREHNSKELRAGAVQHALHCKTRRMKEEKNILPENFDAESYINAGYGNLVALEKGQTFDLGGKTVKVIEVPGHTAGSVGIYCPEGRVFCAGDAMNDTEWMFCDPSMSLTTYAESVKKALALDIDGFTISHAPEVRDKKILLDYLGLAQRLLDDPEGEFGSAEKFETKMSDDDIRILYTKGFEGMENFGKPGFASLFIGRKQLH